MTDQAQSALIDDLDATVYRRFGIDPKTEVHDALGRPHPLALGDPIRAIFG